MPKRDSSETPSDQANTPSSTQAFQRVMTVMIAFAGGAAVIFDQLPQGWYPLDDGILAATADRVLAGEFPHIDFVDPYTGGLSLLNGWWISIFPDTMLSLRVPLVIALVAMGLASYTIARRWVGFGTALTVSWVNTVLPIVVFPIPMPTWYTTALTVVALAIVLAPGAPFRKAVLAGLVLGLAVVIKVTALYAVSALIAWYLAQWRFRGHRVLASVVGLAPIVVLVNDLTPRHVVFFAVPLIVAVSLLSRPDGIVTPIRRSPVVGLAIGGSVLPTIFLVAAATHGDAFRVIEGAILDSVSVRIADVARMPPSALGTLLMAVIAAVPFSAARRREFKTSEVIGFGLLVTAASLIGRNQAGQVVVTLMLAAMPVVVGAATRLGRRFTGDLSALALIVLVASSSALVGYPFYTTQYTIYIFPVLALVIVALSSEYPRPAHLVTVPLLPFVVVLAVAHGGYGGLNNSAWIPLDSERGSVEINAHFDPWNAALRFIRTHQDAGFFWAGPESPELYFLSGAVNPLGDTYEFLNANHRFDEVFVESLLEAGVCSVVINRTGVPVTEPPNGAALAELRATFPHVAADRPFEMRWRDDDGCDG